MTVHIPRKRYRVAAAVGLAVFAFGLYVLQLDDSDRSGATPVVATKNDSRPAPAPDSDRPTYAFQTAVTTRPDDPAAQRSSDSLVTGDQDAAPELPVDAPDPLDTLDGTPGVAEPGATDAVDARSLPAPDVVFEAVDPATVSDEVRATYAAGDHRRYRFVKIDGDSLRARIESSVLDDVMHIELFPGEVVSPMQGNTRSQHQNGREESVLWGGGIANHPCSQLNMRVDSQGIVSLRSFHRHAPIFNVELTDQDSIYAITQSRYDNAPTCGDRIWPE